MGSTYVLAQHRRGKLADKEDIIKSIPTIQPVLRLNQWSGVENTLIVTKYHSNYEAEHESKQG